ncbi:hypothetical protein KP509_27G070000 [Ceratopteris richardii]|uniref:Pentatricopeptide repeat-containing protein n=1 Tax=Ceratopteris richardii TaxID=49495 RepID=A0A8T2RIX6_CERRI|nr:hypothetical protein KP509_27G070000 [Ceratopteris richardii]
MRAKKVCEHGQLQDLFQSLAAISQQGSQAPVAAYISAVKECATVGALEYGRLIQVHIQTSGIVSNVMLENFIIAMYGKCGSLEDAHNTFLHMPVKNVFSWTAIITAYAKEYKHLEAALLFHEMRQNGIEPDKYVTVVALKACAAIEALELGRYIHGDTLAVNTEVDCFICSALIDMYGKCKNVPDARHVFDNMRVRDVVAWNTMLSGYTQHTGLEKEAIFLFEKMQSQGIKPSVVTYAYVIKACALIADLEYGRKVHELVILSGFSNNIFVANSILDMYVKCCCLVDAQDVFVSMPNRDEISWTIIMTGYLHQGMGWKVLMLYKEMLQCGLTPNTVTFVTVLNSCIQEELFEDGRHLHWQILEMGLRLDSFTGSSLVDMYSKCDCMNDAWYIFKRMSKPDLSLWNALIGGCSREGLWEKVKFLFVEMHKIGMEPDGTTFVHVIKAATTAKCLGEGRRLHAYVVEKVLEQDVFVRSTMIDMYAKCQNIEEAHSVFATAQQQDTVLWNTLLGGYVQQGLEEAAVVLYDSMISEKLSPNQSTFTIILKAYTNLTILDWGRLLHNEIFEKGYECSLVLRTAILDMYTKCGSLVDAQYLFQNTCPRDVIAWTAMITGYALQGCGKEALGLLEQMNKAEDPNEVTFVSILCGCSHAGLLGWLESAFLVLEALPVPANEVLWMNLLSFCGALGCVDPGKQVAEEIVCISGW